MNKVITINLAGTAYQLVDAGYEALRAYLETAATRLKGNPDRDEIMADIEQSIGKKFRARLTAHKNVVTVAEVTAVLSEMGPIEDSSTPAVGAGEDPAQPATTSGAAEAQGAASGPAKKLYRIYEGAMISGVCNGLAAYFNIDPIIVRLLFVLLLFFWGAGLWIYLLMELMVPAAKSPGEKAAAFGMPFTAQEFIRRAREGYYEAMRKFSDRHARREGKRQFRREMRAWRWTFGKAQRAQAYAGSGWGAWSVPMTSGDVAGVPPAASAMLPLVTLMYAALKLLLLCAVVTLLATSKILGVSLPIALPVWVTLLLLLCLYGLLAWPLKLVRHGYYRGRIGGPPWAWPMVFGVDLLIWCAFVGVLLWLAYHSFPMVNDAVRHLPAVVHEAVHDIRDWWQSK